MELAAAVALLTLIGWWVDGRFGTAPWGVLVGSLLGLVGGMYNLIRDSLAAVKATSVRAPGSGRGAEPPADPRRHDLDNSGKPGEPRADDRAGADD